MKNIYDDTRSITEPTGALAVAGIKKYVARTGVRDQTLIAIDSGANINFDSLRHVAERVASSEVSAKWWTPKRVDPAVRLDRP